MCLFLFRFEVHVSSTDTVESVKEKVAASQLIAFPEHKLMFKGEKMEEGKTLSDYGIQESMRFFGRCGSCPFTSFLAKGSGQIGGAVQFLVPSISWLTRCVFGRELFEKMGWRVMGRTCRGLAPWTSFWRPRRRAS